MSTSTAAHSPWKFPSKSTGKTTRIEPQLALLALRLVKLAAILGPRANGDRKPTAPN